MKSTHVILIVGSLALTAFGAITPTHENAKPAQQVVADSVDAATGLKIAPGLDLVKANCIACHSPKLITQFKATRQGWLDRIRWMQAKQKLWDLGQNEQPILDYLAKNYPPLERYDRRPPLKDIAWYPLK